MKTDLLYLRLRKVAQALQSFRLLKALLFYQVLSGAEHRRILSNQLLTMIDIGANRGQFALAARRWAGQSRVISFEPVAQAADIFRKVFKNDPMVTLHQVAIGPQRGNAVMHVTAADDSSSFLSTTSMQQSLFPGSHKIREEIVEVGPMDEYLKPNEIVSPAMLKLDVQGYELEALKGCENLLPLFSFVYVECSFIELYANQPLADEVIAWFRYRGWNLDGIHNIVHDGQDRKIQADLLFQNCPVA